MNRRYCFSIASVLAFICIVSVSGFLANALNIIAIENYVKNITALICVISGYSAVYFCGLGINDRQKAKRLIKRFLFVLFVFYLIMLIDFTLINDVYGRNILSVLDPNRSSFSRYLKESTNFIPFKTIILFINGYKNNNLSFADTAVNLLGNFAFFMPLTFFISIFRKEKMGFIKMLIWLLSAIIAIELLQVIFMTGSCDIDDLILNLSGAMLFYFLICKTRFSNVISRLTFGVWK